MKNATVTQVSDRELTGVTCKALPLCHAYSHDRPFSFVNKGQGDNLRTVNKEAIYNLLKLFISHILGKCVTNEIKTDSAQSSSNKYKN